MENPKIPKKPWRSIALLGCVLSGFMLLFLSGCEAMKSAKPIVPVREYERLTVGDFEANYIGTDNCLTACHFHDHLRGDFDASTMGAQLSEDLGMPLVDCESCHGPGSLAVEGITKEKAEEAASRGEELACKYDTLIDLENLPAGAQSLICNRCHTGNATINLHNWNASPHAMNDVSCSDCHKVHEGPDLIVQPRKTSKMCFGCHQEQMAQFSLPSRHPVKEGRIFCTDCHDPHGTTSAMMYRNETLKATCTQCHAERGGPFVYEHAGNTEDCSTCHSPHGSPNNNLLVMRSPFLCLQCHGGHRTAAFSASTDTYTRCSDCHSSIHGSDVPGASGTGRFTQ